MSTRRLETLLGHLRAGEEARGVAPNKTAGGAGTLAKKYKYTLDNDVLTPEQRDFYEENGYLVIRGLIKSAELEDYKKRFGEICRREVKVCRGPLVTAAIFDSPPFSLSLSLLAHVRYQVLPS